LNNDQHYLLEVWNKKKKRYSIKISMFDYVDEILTAFDKAEPKGGGTKSSAAPDSLLKVNESCDKLEQDKAVEFHNLVVNTLYATKRARPDTCTIITFLTVRVREPDKDDWIKLVHLMRYIRGTRTMPLILSANGSGILKWWVDASFAVHPNMRALRRRTVFGTWISHREFHQAEAQYLKLHGDQYCGR
jgi:hypothetical protein